MKYIYVHKVFFNTLNYGKIVNFSSNVYKYFLSRRKMNVAVIFANLFTILSVHSTPLPANYFDWLRSFKLKANTILSANGANGNVDGYEAAPKSCLPNAERSSKKFVASLKADSTTYYITSSQMTKEICSRHCKDTFGIPIVYALFDGNKCFCLPQTSNAWNYFSSLEDIGLCDSKCSGRRNQFCGGSFSTFVAEA
jgi:hypothetical protein